MVLARRITRPAISRSIHPRPREVQPCVSSVAQSSSADDRLWTIEMFLLSLRPSCSPGREYFTMSFTIIGTDPFIIVIVPLLSQSRASAASISHVSLSRRRRRPVRSIVHVTRLLPLDFARDSRVLTGSLQPQSIIVCGRFSTVTHARFERQWCNNIIINNNVVRVSVPGGSRDFCANVLQQLR